MLPEHERRETQDRFAAYRRTGDVTIRDTLVHDHLRLAAHLASRYANRGVATDDLMQVASIGLLRAVERYEPERGLEFSTFATPTIVGELKRHFRDKGWAVRVPRRVQELHLRLNVVVGELTHHLGRSPTIAELANATRSSEEDVLEALDAAHAYRTTSIDAPGPSGEHSNAREPASDDDHFFRSEDRLVIEALLATLEPREQLMVRLRFYEEMTQSEIAARLGISQMHVSRLLAGCLERLRHSLDAEG